MYLRLIQFALGTGKRSVAEELAGKLVPTARAQKGCVRCEFFADDEAGDYGVVAFWESREAADAASMVMGPILRGGLGPVVKGPPSIRLFEVYEPTK